MSLKLSAHILSDSAIAPLLADFDKAALRFELDISFHEGEFGAFENSSFFHTNSTAPDILILLPCLPQLRIRHRSDPRNFVGKEFQKWYQLWQRALNKPGLRMILHANFPTPYEIWLGNQDRQDPASFTSAVLQLNEKISQALLGNQVKLLDLAHIAAWTGLQSWHDQRFWITSRLMCSPTRFPFVAEEILRVISKSIMPSVKCIVTDFDGTLWGGIIGEDGLNKIESGLNGIGEAFLEYQYILLHLKERGIFLAGCTRNNERMIKEAFKNSDMKIKSEDFVIIKSVRDSKIPALQEIRKELNLSWDSMIFLDDEAYERDSARTLCPGLIVPNLPDDPVERILFLLKMNLLPDTKLTNESRLRTRNMASEFERLNTKKDFSDVTSYLNSLKMRLSIRKNKSEDLDRVVEIFQRTNQYNLALSRPSRSMLLKWINDGNDIITFDLEDKFGGYGLISVVMINATHEVTLESFTMSCRVAARGIEETILYIVGQICVEKKLDSFKMKFLISERNQTFRSLLETYGLTIINLENQCFLMVDVAELKKSEWVKIIWN